MFADEDVKVGQYIGEYVWEIYIVDESGNDDINNELWSLLSYIAKTCKICEVQDLERNSEKTLVKEEIDFMYIRQPILKCWKINQGLFALGNVISAEVCWPAYKQWALMKIFLCSEKMSKFLN